MQAGLLLYLLETRVWEHQYLVGHGIETRVWEHQYLVGHGIRDEGYLIDKSFLLVE